MPLHVQAKAFTVLMECTLLLAESVRAPLPWCLLKWKTAMIIWKTCLQLKWTVCETGKADFTPSTLSSAMSKAKASELMPRDKSHLGHLKLPELTHHATAELRPDLCVPMMCSTSDARLTFSILLAGARNFSLVHTYPDKLVTQRHLDGTVWFDCTQSSKFCSKNGCLSCMLHGRLNMLCFKLLALGHWS